MGEEGLGSEGGGGRAERIRRDEGGGSNDGKTSSEYARGPRESRSVGEAEVMLVGFQMRNGFRGSLVTELKERGYHGKKAGGRAYQGGKPEGELSWLQDVRKRAEWELVHWERRDEEAGCWGLSIRGVAAPGGVKFIRTQKGRVQCARTLTCPSRHIGHSPCTSRRNDPRQTHPELELMLSAPETPGALGELGETKRKVFLLLMYGRQMGRHLGTFSYSHIRCYCRRRQGCTLAE